MKIPNYENVKLSDKDGYLTTEWQKIMNQLFTELQNNVSDEGVFMPHQGVTNISALSTAKSIGSILYNSDTHKFMGCYPSGSVGIYKEFVSGASAPTLSGLTLSNLNPNTALIADGLKAIQSSITTSIELGYLSGVTSGVQSQLNGKEPTITAGLITQYWRGDKSWQILNTAVVPENTNLYYTDARARLSISETITGIDYNNLTGVFSLTTGYVIPTTTEETNWNDAYAKRVNTWTAPLQFSSNTASMTQAGSASNGWLSSADWNTFNNKYPPAGNGVWIHAEGSANYNNRRVRTVAGTATWRFNFSIPGDFVTLDGVYLVGYPTAGASGAGKNIDFIVEYTTTAGQLYNQFTASDTTSTYNLTGYTDRQYRFNLTALFTSLSAHTEGGILVDHNAIGGAINYVGILVIYH